MAEEEKLYLKKAIQFGINGYIPSVKLCIRNENAPKSYYACCLDNMQIKLMWLVHHKKSWMTNGELTVKKEPSGKPQTQPYL